MKKYYIGLILLFIFIIVGCQSHPDIDQVVNQEKSVKADTKTSETTSEVSSDNAQVIEPTAYKKIMAVIGSSASVHNQPGDDQKEIAQLNKETTVNVFEKTKIEDKTWYHITLEDGKKGWVSSSEVGIPTSKQLNVKLVSQLPELPNGCEITSLTMLLQSAGVDVDKMTLADKMKKVPFEENGLKGDPNEGFVGNMYHGPPGYAVYHGPVADLAKQYLKDRVVDLTGSDWSKIEAQIIKGSPVWVIVNVQFRKLSDGYWEDWKTKNGTLKVTMQEHSVLVTGFDKDYVYFNDPLAGVQNRKAKKSDFKAAWIQQHSQAISYN